MRKQTILKSTLCLLFTLVCHVAWAQPEISDAPASGQWAQNTTWFRMETGDDYSYRADVLTTGGYLALTNKVDAVGDVALWCIVGDADNGYHFYNRAKGADVVLGMKDGYAEFVAAGTSGYVTAFDFVQSTKTGYWCAKEHGSANNYLNRKNNGDYHLMFWDSSSAQKGDNGSAMLFTEVDLSTLTELYASESEITTAQGLIKVAPGYPKTTSVQYRMLDVMVNSVGKGIIAAELATAVNNYKTCTDIILPEDGKAYTFTALFKNGNKLHMKYENGTKVSVSTNSADASTFVCKELRAGVYAFITEDGKILTWIGNNETGAYKENNNIYGYSSNYATVYNTLSDWNEITVKKNDGNAEQFGLLRLVARRHNTSTSSIIANKDNRFDQASDGNWFNNDNTSGWIVTEVKHTINENQQAAIAEIDATITGIAHVEANASKLGTGIGYAHYMIGDTKVTDAETVKTAINNATSAEEVNAIRIKYEVPQVGLRYALYDDTHKTYLDIYNLGVEANDGSYNQLATMNVTAQLLYITGNENDGTWKIHTTPKGGSYLHQASGRSWNSWVSSNGGDFRWEVKIVADDGAPRYMLKNISGNQNGYLGADSHTAGNPLYVNQTDDEKKLKMQLIPVMGSITGVGTTTAEWLAEECVDVLKENIPEGVKNLSNYSSFVDDNYTYKIKTCGEYFYLNAGCLTGLFSWRSGSGNKRVNIVAVEVVDLAGVVVAADYHWGYAGNPSSKNTYTMDIPQDGLYYLRYYAETASNGGVNDSDIDITYTLMESKVYIAADAKQPDGTYKKYYLYNDNGTLKASLSCNSEAKYKWNRSKTAAGNYTFANAAGQHLGYDHTRAKGLVIADTPVELVISTTDAVHAGAMGMKRVGDDGDGKFMVTKFDGSEFNRNSGKSNNGSWTSDYIFTPSTLKAFTIVANVPESESVFTCGDYELEVGASILCTGVTGKLGIKSCKSTYALEGFYSDAAYTNKITDVDVEVLESDMTIYAKFTPNIFSETYGEKWVNIVRATNANHAAALGSTAEGTIPTFNDLDFTNKGMIWCFVGDANNFKIYNLLCGEGLVLIPSGEPSDGVSVKMGPATEVQNWYIKEYTDGYAIIPVGNQDWGINSYTGTVGSQIKFYGVGDSGTHWNFNLIDAKNTLTFDVQVEGIQPYASNTRVANLNTTLAEYTSTSIVKSSIAQKTYYLPVGATFTLNNSYTYRGYKFNGFFDADGNTAEYTNTTIPEGGLNIKASYSVDMDNKYQYLFYNRDDVYNKPYRIPAIATASNNTVLAFSDYRPCANDIGYGEVDIMLRRSYDNGKTWSDAVCIADGQGGNSNVFNVGFGDAAVVADRESGKVLVMAVAGKQVFAYGSETNHNSMAKIVSNDNGEKWGNPEDVTSQFMIAEGSLFPKAYTMFFGSGRLLQSRVYKAEGSKYYRIYGALLVKHANDTYTGSCNFVVYSDDFGDTWKILGGSIDAGMCCNGGDEPKVEELPDGSIILSSRKYYGRYFNVFTYTDKAKGEGKWSAAVASNDQTGGIKFGGNATNGEIYKVKAIHNESGRICDVMLQSIPTGGGRSNVSVYYKEMDYAKAYTPTTFAQNWTKGLEVSAIESAYSTMTLQADGNFGFFYEEYPGDQWSYCMVYVPLSLEEITNNAYSLVDLVLDEKTTVAPQINKKYKQVVVNRTIKGPAEDKEYGNWNTFVVPFGMAIPEGWQVKQLVSSTSDNDNISLVFGDAKSIEAGVPYMVRTTKTVNNIVVKDVTVNTELKNASTDHVDFVGTYTNGYVPAGAFFISSNTFYQAADETNTMKAFRAYLQPKVANARSLSYRTDGETTAIDNSPLINDNEVTVVAIYNLQGVRLDDMHEGVNILQMSNGSKVKVIIK